MTDSGVDDRISPHPASYRCVCGGNVELGSRQPSVECPLCGRVYQNDFLQAAGADTISIDADLRPARLITPAEDDPFIGRRLGHFQILSRIGDGGMGAVYKALDESLQRYVALKVIHNPAGGSQGDADLDRLFQEARAQARVNHPHVVHVYYVAMDNKIPFLAMELVGNGTLADRIKQGPIAFLYIVRYALQITRALGCAAEYEIVHGDIKPSNVLLVDDKTVKLSDFGLARRLSTPSTTTSKLSGTPDYMSPEATLGSDVDHRGDMYSLGVTLFQATFGRLPYSADRDAELSDRLRLHREAEIEFPERWPAELPESWRFLLARLMSKDSAQRPRSFAELESELNAVAPTDTTSANLLLRTFAWMIDLALLLMGITVIRVLVTFAQVSIRPLESRSVEVLPELGIVASLVDALVAVAFLTGIALLQAHWGNTTGKRFLQILIVDRHGLKPQRRILAVRSVFQFSLVWSYVINRLFAAIGLQGLASLLALAVVTVLLIEIGSVLVRRGRSFHDWILGTRVVLDASRESDAAVSISDSVEL